MDSPFSRFNAQWQRVLVLVSLTLVMALPGLAGLQVIDRDEARYAQASVQMVESRDYVNIRFQDEARNKKPAGIYWLQAGAMKLLGGPGERRIWVQRLPSVLGALLAVLATYWGGARLIGRDGAFAAAILLAVSGLFVFEAHIAKTDAVLCGLSALALGCIAHLRNGGGKRSAILLWASMGAAVMIKGPILPGIVILTILTLLIWERKAGWLRPLQNPMGIALFLLMVLPWTIMIWKATNGQFFADSLGTDFGGKIVGVQEKHPGLPGYYSVLIWATFWPACLFLLPGLAFAIRAVRGENQTVVSGCARLLLAWTIPFWLAIEFMPTKLPHYPLPVFPALALLSAAALMTLFSVKEFPVTRRVSALIYLLISMGLAVGIAFGASEYGQLGNWPIILAAIVVIIAIYASLCLWTMKTKQALWASVLSAVILSMGLYHFILPALTDLRLSDRIESTLRESNIALPRTGGGLIFSPDFREPSLVYRLGKDLTLSDVKLLTEATWDAGFTLIVDVEKDSGLELRATIMQLAERRNACLRELPPVKGLNYSKGEPVSLVILEVKPCEPNGR